MLQQDTSAGAADGPQAGDEDSPVAGLSPTQSGPAQGTGTGSGNGMATGQGVGNAAGGAGAAGGGGSGPAGAPGGSTANAALKVERYRPCIFGFPTHETAKLHRWQEKQRDIQVDRLESAEAGVVISSAPDAGVGPDARTGTGGLD